MQDFENKDLQDEDEVRITDLDPQDEVSDTSLLYILLRRLRKIRFPANTRAKLTMLALLIGVIVLLLLLQPALLSMPRQASSTPLPATSSSLPGRSLPSVVVVSATDEVTWIKAPDDIVFTHRASDGTLTWRHCKLHQQFVPGQESRPGPLNCQ
jgi:hypothetical protein